MNFIKSKLVYKSSVFEDLMIGIAAILAGYFYYYENRRIVVNIENPERVNYAIKIATGIIIVVVWLYLSFRNGAKKRGSFLIGAIVVWVLPQIVKYFVDHFDTGVYSSPLRRSFALFARYISGTNYLSLLTLGNAVSANSGIPYYITLNLIIILFEITFVIGFVSEIES